jgi:hypothetical protein
MVKCYLCAMNENLTELLLERTKNLPAQQLRELIDFSEFLASKTAAAASQAQPARALKAFVGGVTHGSLASGIDDELYGASVC